MTFQGLFEDGLVGHHHTQVDDLETVTAQDDAHDILTDVVYVAVGCGQHDTGPFFFPVFSFLVDIGLQQGHSILHHLSRFHHLGQEHLPFTKQSTDMFHRLHQRLFNHVDGSSVLLEGLRDILFQVLAHALAQRIGQSFLDGFLPPGVFRHGDSVPLSGVGCLLFLIQLGRQFYQSFGGSVVFVQDDILHRLEQGGFDVVVNL